MGKGNEPFGVRMQKRIAYLPIVLAQRQHVFSLRWYGRRRSFSASTRKRIDRIFFEEKLRATDVTQNYYKAEGVAYTQDEIKATRILCKNLDALVFTTEQFAEMYPDATFISLVRNGLAICEGHKRRGASVEQIGRLYGTVCSQIILDAERLPNFHIIKYETLISDTLATIKKMYELTGLDGTRVDKFRLVVNRGERGSGHTGGMRMNSYGIPPRNMPASFRRDITTHKFHYSLPTITRSFCVMPEAAWNISDTSNCRLSRAREISRQISRRYARVPVGGCLPDYCAAQEHRRKYRNHTISATRP